MWYVFSVVEQLVYHRRCSCTNFASIHSLVQSSVFLVCSQTKNPGHFTAWSSCLLSHEMYRKTQLAAGTAPEGQSHIGRSSTAPTVTFGEEDSLDSWADRTQTTITGVRKGMEVWWYMEEGGVCVRHALVSLNLGRSSVEGKLCYRVM